MLGTKFVKLLFHVKGCRGLPDEDCDVGVKVRYGKEVASTPLRRGKVVEWGWEEGVLLFDAWTPAGLDAVKVGVVVRGVEVGSGVVKVTYDMEHRKDVLITTPYQGRDVKIEAEIELLTAPALKDVLSQFRKRDSSASASAASPLQSPTGLDKKIGQLDEMQNSLLYDMRLNSQSVEELAVRIQDNLSSIHRMGAEIGGLLAGHSEAEAKLATATDDRRNIRLKIEKMNVEVAGVKLGVERMTERLVGFEKFHEAEMVGVHEEVRSLSRQLDEADKRTVSVAVKTEFLGQELEKASVAAGRGRVKKSDGFGGLFALSILLPYLVKGAYVPLFFIWESLTSLSLFRFVLVTFGIIEPTVTVTPLAPPSPDPPASPDLPPLHPTPSNANQQLPPVDVDTEETSSTHSAPANTQQTLLDSLDMFGALGES